MVQKNQIEAPACEFLQRFNGVIGNVNLETEIMASLTR
jgi:hypothetical protein